MKLNLTYQLEEQEQANAALAALLALLPGVRVRKNASKPPYIHVYLTTRKPKNRCNSGENA